jgi:hypothetical protein
MDTPERGFDFEGGAAGIFLDDGFPQFPGRYRYMPYRSGSHYRMGQRIQATGSAVCTYDDGGRRVRFTVRSCGEYGLLDLSDFEIISDSS